VKAKRPAPTQPGNPGNLAKLTRPRQNAVVARERLFQRLDELLAHPVVWIVGPPGAGKTSLLSSYAEARGRPTLWYQIDPGDVDAATFFHYLRHAASGLDGAPDAAPLPALLPEYLPDLAGFTRRFFRALYARLPSSAIVALDDYQALPAEAPLHRVIAGALAELPEGVHCVVASRAAPPPECARLIANRAIVSLDWQDLRLTEDETAAIARSRKISDSAVIAAAHQRAGGWVAGLILLVDQSAAGRLLAAPSLAPSSPALYNYCAELFERAVSDEVREALLSIAVLPGITGRVAARLTGNEHAERILQDLHERSFFVDCRPGSEPTYHLHALFRSFLQEFLRRNRPPNERLARLQQAADVLDAVGEKEQAASLYGEAGCWDKAAEIVLGLAPGLLMQGRWQTLQDRIVALPEGEVTARPWLQYWLGASRMASNMDLARATLVSAYEAFVRRQDVAGQAVAAATVVESYFIEYGDFTGLDRWIDALESLLDSRAILQAVGAELQVYSRLVHALVFRAPWHPALPDYARRLLDLAQGEADPSQRIVAAAALSHYLSWIGDFDADRHARAVVRPLLEHPDISPIRKAYALGCVALSAHMRADSEQEALFAQAFALIEQHGLRHFQSWMQVGDCWRHLYRGEFKLVASLLTAMEGALVPAQHLNGSQFRFVQGWLELLQGNLVLARQHAEASVALAVLSGAPYGESFTLLLLAQVLAELDDHAGAAECLARFRARMGGVRSAMFDFNVALVEAYGAWRRRDHEGCTAALRTALGIGRSHGYVSTLFWYPRMMSSLCGFALERRIEEEYATLLIRRRRLRPMAPIENWPWLVKVYTLGSFDVFVGGDELRVEGKAQRKPLELLKVLVALGGRDVPAESLIDVLWPEPKQGDGQKALDITIHRLRRLLSSDETVQVSDRRVTLNPLMVWVDASALDNALTPVVASPHDAGPAAELLEAAAPQVLHLYRGQFLAGDAGKAWQMSIANRLTGRFQRYALRLGQYWESARQWQPAAALYQRAIELDPLAESFYRRQMICLEALGGRAEAIEVYRRCRQTLSVTLGVAPTSETDAVYRRLIAS
jgi:LuxR family transcriptional regulator, maltose regulon positive regulatory protein